MDSEPGDLGEPAADHLVLMGGVVVHDEVKRFVWRGGSESSRRQSFSHSRWIRPTLLAASLLTAAMRRVLHCVANSGLQREPN